VLRRTYGFADEARVAAHLAAGEIDVLAGDDVALSAALVGAASRRV
jgi:hypothetical protein